MTEPKESEMKTPAPFRFESEPERALWLRIFERDGLVAADAAAMAFRERSATPVVYEFTLKNEKDRWAARLREIYVGVEATEKEYAQVTGQPLDPQMRAFFNGRREGIESCIAAVERGDGPRRVLRSA